MWQIQKTIATFVHLRRGAALQFFSGNGGEENPGHRREAHIWEQNRPV
jgi:hypothetical protein